MPKDFRGRQLREAARDIRKQVRAHDTHGSHRAAAIKRKRAKSGKK